MKNLFVFGALALALTVAACGGETKNNEEATVVEEVVVDETVAMDTTDIVAPDSTQVDSTENVQ